MNSSFIKSIGNASLRASSRSSIISIASKQSIGAFVIVSSSNNVFGNVQKNIYEVNRNRLFSSSSSSSSSGTSVPAASASESSGTFLDVKEVTDRVLNVLKNMEKVDKSKLTAKSHFTNDLGLDSLDAVEVVMAFEEEFVIEIPDDIAEKILSCEDAIKFISQHPQAR